MNRFRDIPQLTTYGSWECSFPMDRVLKQIDTWIDEEGLDIDPDFQRAHVWTDSQQSAWMEFMFRGGKTGRVLYFNNPDWNRFRVRAPGNYREFVLVDGKQRLNAIRRFYADEIRVFGAFRSEFEDEPDMLRQSRMLINVNDLRSRAEVLRWYVEFNAGGTPHTAEEIQRVTDLLDAELKAGATV
jgi:hypothetical protein